MSPDSPSTRPTTHWVLRSIQKHSRRRPDTRSTSEIANDLKSIPWTEVRQAIQDLQDQGAIERQAHKLGAGWVAKPENLPPESGPVPEKGVIHRKSTGCGKLFFDGHKSWSEPFLGSSPPNLDPESPPAELCSAENGISHSTPTPHPKPQPQPAAGCLMGMGETAQVLTGRSVVRSRRPQHKAPTYSPDSAQGLVSFFEEKTEPMTGNQAWPVNRGALAKEFAAMKRRGLSPEVLRELIGIFVVMEESLIRAGGTAAWRQFLRTREQHLPQAQSNLKMRDRTPQVKQWGW